MSESRDKHRSPQGDPEHSAGADEDLDTYELDLGDDEEPSPPQAQPTKKSGSTPSGSPDQEIEDTYDLTVPDEPPAAPAKRPSHAPVKEGEDKTAETRSAPPSSARGPSKALSQTTSAADPRAEAPPASPGSSIISGEEPKFVDATVAAGRREEARIRRAQEEAEADAKRRKRNMIYIGIIVAIVIFLIVWLNV